MKKIGCKKVSFKLVMINGFFLSVAYPLAYAVINDTGITWCSNSATNNLACPVTNFPRQDGDFGRDVTNNDDTDGHAGFSFTKLDSQDKDLPNDATSWDCVRDNVTGMIWENKTSDGGLRDVKWTYTWYNSSLSNPGTENGGTCYQSGRCDTEKYVQDVNAAGLCGFKDWRMPSPIELVSIVDYSIPSPDPTIDTDYFSNTVSDWFWTSSPHADSSYYAWYVYFGYGYVDDYYGKDDAGQVRLVRSGQYSLIFEDLNDGTVSQTNTGLMWAKCAEGLSGDSCTTGTAKDFTWQQALQAANKSRLAGYDDWRLPNIKELQSLVDYSTNYPAIDSTYFPNTPTYGTYGWFWASSPDAKYSNGAWVVGFCDGYVSKYYKFSTFQVRFVRNEQFYTISINKADNGTVISEDGKINCGTGVGCSASYLQDTSVTLNAKPDDGYKFDGWSGSSCSGTGSCTVTLSANTSVTATFTAISTELLMIVKTGVGIGTITSDPVGIICGQVCMFKFPRDSQITLTAQPDGDSIFDRWTGAWCSGTSSTCTLKLDQAKTVTAVFKSKPKRNLTVKLTGSGRVTSDPAGINCGTLCDAKFNTGTVVTLTATPPDPVNFEFTGWAGDDCTGLNPTCTITLNVNKNVEAHFGRIPRYTLTVKQSKFGTVTSDPTGINCGVDCLERYLQGTVVKLTATPQDSLHQFVSWGGDCAQETKTTCTLTMVKAKTVTVRFAPIKTYILTVARKGSGTVTSYLNGDPDGKINCGKICQASYPKGTVVTLLAAWNELTTVFQGWEGSCTGTGVCVLNINQDFIINATFTRKP